MIIDGRKIAEDIFVDLKQKIGNAGKSPKLTVFTCAPNFETEKYLNLKKRKAGDVGIEMQIVEHDQLVTTDELILSIKESVSKTDAIIVQLPLPDHIDTKKVLENIPVSHDVDALNNETKKFLSPVVGAIKEILKIHTIEISGKSVFIIGAGKLVGQPALEWFKDQGTDPVQVTLDTENLKHSIEQADIILCGAGVPGLLTPDMVKEGAVVLDAGTSEDGGELRGDADPACADKCSIFTPVPGGIGPITIAILLKNVFDSVGQK